MRHVIGCAVTLGLLACSSGPGPGPDPNPNPPTEPAPKPVYTEITYPTENLGNDPGKVVRDVTFNAFLPNAAKGETSQISMHDLYDPDGVRGINAVMIITSAEWCGACKQEATTLESKIQTKWGAEGVQVIELIIEDTQSQSAPDKVAAAADRWRTSYNLKNMIVGMDSAKTFFHSGTNGLPLNVVIDPRTMTMVSRTDGFSPKTETDVANLVAKNKL